MKINKSLMTDLIAYLYNIDDLKFFTVRKIVLLPVDNNLKTINHMLVIVSCCYYDYSKKNISALITSSILLYFKTLNHLPYNVYNITISFVPVCRSYTTKPVAILF